MIKQIKRTVAVMLLCGISLSYTAFAFPTSVGENKATPAIETSDVVENKSVIEKQEQICETPEPEVSVSKVVTNTPEPKVKEYLTGWTTTNVNVRENPNLNATILTTYDFNTQIQYLELDNEWVEIEYGEDVAYMAKDYISNNKCDYIEYEIPHSSGFKSYMGYKAITNKSSKQYLIQNSYAYTGDYGIRQVNGRFCVALGSYFGVNIGQYFDLVLENGTIIPCIMGDAKANKDTDNNNLFTSANGCCSEFIVDSSALVNSAKTSGNISNVSEEWNSPVKFVRVYEENILN